MSDGACCTCCRVRYAPEENPDGSFSERWACEDCGAAFCRQAASDYHAASVRREAGEVAAGLARRQALQEAGDIAGMEILRSSRTGDEKRIEVASRIQDGIAELEKATIAKMPAPDAEAPRAPSKFMERFEKAGPFPTTVLASAAAPRAEPRDEIRRAHEEKIRAWFQEATGMTPEDAKAAYLADFDRLLDETTLPGAPARAEEPPPERCDCGCGDHAPCHGEGCERCGFTGKVAKQRRRPDAMTATEFGMKWNAEDEAEFRADLAALLSETRREAREEDAERANAARIELICGRTDKARAMLTEWVREAFPRTTEDDLRRVRSMLSKHRALRDAKPPAPCPRCNDTGDDPEHEGPCGECMRAAEPPEGTR